MLHRLIEAIQVTHFGISRRTFAKHFLIEDRRMISYQQLILLIGFFHKLISVQDIRVQYVAFTCSSTADITQSFVYQCVVTEIAITMMLS